MASRPRGVHWWVSAVLVLFGAIMAASLAVQNFSSQRLIEHPYWADLLRNISAEQARQVAAGREGALPHDGMIRGWYVHDGGLPAGVPDHLAALPPGLYSTEGGFGTFTALDAFNGMDAFHAMVVARPGGRLITMIDVEALETQQNRTSVLSTLWMLVVVALVGGLIVWLHANLVRPVRDLAARMQAIDPADPQARLPTDYRREEIQVIAQASNAHLERVARFIARERSLLDQASHEFRTPVAVIAGAVDVLRQMPLPDTSGPALARIDEAVGDLSATMVALLYLSRESSGDAQALDVTALHALLPRLLHDHAYLLQGKPVQLRIGTLQPGFVMAPEAMVRIAVSNLIRNAVENSDEGTIVVDFEDGLVSVTDPGSGFDPAEAANRYREMLRTGAPLRGQGLGLYLISRICERFGWTLSIDAGGDAMAHGTVARLDVRSGMIPLPTDSVDSAPH